MPKSAKTVLSITSAALEADGRTLRSAHTIRRMGHHSIVVEGAPSRKPEEFNLSLISLDTRAQASKQENQDTDDRSQTLRAMTAALRFHLRNGTNNHLINTALFQVYRAGFLWKYGINPLFRLPKADLICLHGFLFSPVVQLMSHLYQTPFLYDAHDFYQDIRSTAELPEFDQSHIQPYLQKVEAECIRNAREILTVSNTVADLIETRYGRRPLVLRNLQDECLYNSLAIGSHEPDLRTQLKLSDSDFLVVVVGNCKPGQAIQEFTTGLSMADKHIHVALVGSGYEQHHSTLAEAGIADRVHTPGPVQPQHILSHIRRADAAAIIYLPMSSNYKAALPNGFFQAVSAHLPVLVGDELPEVVEIVNKYRMGSPIDLGDPASIAHTLNMFARSPDLRSRYKAGASQASVDLNWRNEEALLVERITKALEAG